MATDGKKGSPHPSGEEAPVSNVTKRRPQSKRRDSTRQQLPDTLREPIKWDGPGQASLLDMLSDDRMRQREQELKAAFERVLAQRLKKMELLEVQYGIQKIEPPIVRRALLALHLAEDYIPGFSIDFGQKKRGAPTRWTQELYTALIADVESIKREMKCGDSRACDFLKARHEKGRGQWGMESPDSLEARLSEARRAKFNPLIGRLLRHASDEDERQNTVSIIIRLFGACPKCFARPPSYVSDDDGERCIGCGYQKLSPGVGPDQSD